MMRFLNILAASLISAIAVACAHAEDLPASERLAMRGEKHALLDPLLGEWAVAMDVYAGPAQLAWSTDGLSATRTLTLGGRYLREELRGADGVPVREGTLGYNALDQRFELVTADSFEPGQMVYFGRGDETAERFSLYGESTEAGMQPEPTGRKRDLRFEFEIRDANFNVERIFVRYPGKQEYLFVEQRFSRVAEK